MLCFTSYASDVIPGLLAEPGSMPAAEHNDFDDSIFVDDAILIEKYMDEFGQTRHLSNLPRDFSTVGTVSVHINANRQGNGNRFDHWLDFALNW